MNRTPVYSSRISSVGWDNNTLEVQFKDGAIYQYYNVSYSEYSNFINASSLGSALSYIDKTHNYHRIY
ncbi:MAG: KTSC domain-containing protein [Clostridia bacterium]